MENNTNRKLEFPVTVTCCPNTVLTISGLTQVDYLASQVYQFKVFNNRYSYTWSVSGAELSILTSDIVQVKWTSAGNHILSVKESVCNSNGQLDISVACPASISTPPTDRIKGELTPCYNDRIKYELSPYLQNKTYNWNSTLGNIILRSSNTVEVLWDQEGVGSLSVVSDEAYCSDAADADSIPVFRNDFVFDLGPDIEADCEAVVLTIPSSFGGDILRSSGEKTPKITINNSSVVKLKLTDRCLVWEDSLKIVKETPLSNVPNALTPNDDGANDNFLDSGCIALVGRLELKVYSRWDILVYSNKDYKGQWSPNNVPDGTYYYLLSNSDLNTEVKGWVRVIR